MPDLCHRKSQMRELFESDIKTAALHMDGLYCGAALIDSAERMSDLLIIGKKFLWGINLSLAENARLNVLMGVK